MLVFSLISFRSSGEGLWFCSNSRRRKSSTSPEALVRLMELVSSTDMAWIFFLVGILSKLEVVGMSGEVGKEFSMNDDVKVKKKKCIKKR